MKLNVLLILTAIIFLLGCSANRTTEVVIVTCLDEDMLELTEQVYFNINGKSFIWTPGSQLVAEIPMRDDFGMLEIYANSENYTLNSPRTYQINRSEGLDLILLFKKAVDMPDLIVETPVNIDELKQETSEEKREDVEVRTEVRERVIEYGELEIRIQPFNARLTLSSNETRVDTVLNIRQPTILRLPAGNYSWRATASDHIQESGTLNIATDQFRRLDLQLEERVFFGRVSAIVTPSDVRIRLRNLSTDEVQFIDNNDTRELQVGNYEYEITAEGFLPVISNIEINRDASRVISHNLESLSVNQLVSRLRNVRSLQEANSLRNSIPDERPHLTIMQAQNYFNSLIDFANFVLNEGEIQLAFEIYDLIIEQDHSNYSARLQYASVLKANMQGNISSSAEIRNYFENLRNVIRPVFGQLLNLVPVSDRAEIEFRARFAHAEAFYLEYYTYAETDFSNRGRVGPRAYGELRDFLTRYQRLSERSQSLLMDEYQRAREYENIIKSDLGL